MSKTEIYKNIDSLAPVHKVLNEAGQALKDKSRTIETSDIPEILGPIAGGTAGIGAGLMLVSAAGSVAGLSAAGITSGLAALGGVVGGGMVAGIFVAAAPMAILGGGAYALISHHNKMKLIQEKEVLLQEVVRKHDRIIRELKNTVNKSEERIQYLTSLNIVLRQVIKDLESDLALNS